LAFGIIINVSTFGGDHKAEQRKKPYRGWIISLGCKVFLPYMVSGASGIILGEAQSAVVLRDETRYPEPGHGTRNPLPVSTDSLFTFRIIIKTEVGF